ncbi:hypothetical protein K435DRAFT_792887 [Dendrothele bispora CBS 962.96]|uniref:Uncharacterized protein n=1 Tax=Dendrothele bispora (strain CBS 962.96) TaxID=1314807 RepID=A0A4S8MHD9_DENBC|nr:hypothetical protein K435DRAFT_792887 [Dendrothele bispora CBS 962.96]
MDRGQVTSQGFRDHKFLTTICISKEKEKQVDCDSNGESFDKRNVDKELDDDEEMEYIEEEDGTREAADMAELAELNKNLGEVQNLSTKDREVGQNTVAKNIAFLFVTALDGLNNQKSETSLFTHSWSDNKLEDGRFFKEMSLMK